VNIERKKAAVKRAIGAVPASVHLVPLDFERKDLIGVLTEHGYRPDTRTFFIWEGVTQYLTEDAVRATLGALQASPGGSRLVFTYVRKDFIDGVNMYGRGHPVQAFQATSAGGYDDCMKGVNYPDPSEQLAWTRKCCLDSGGVWNDSLGKCQSPPAQPGPRAAIATRPGVITQTLEPTPPPVTSVPGGVIWQSLEPVSFG
ncbi:MAG: hypothetical protein QOD36_1428, partial [Mycobacterium sp.]|nr:hypothetical protein [Mycobacterium sp.]